MSDDVRKAILRDRLNRASGRQDDPEDRAQRGAGSAGRTELEHAAVVEMAIQQAIRQGKFDDLPGAGKPLEGLDGARDPDWWIRRKIETEKLSGLGPPALVLRVEDAELDDRLDGMAHESDVRDALEDFNLRVVEARRQLLGGPPVITRIRDVDAEAAAWRERREQRKAAEEAQREQRERQEREQARSRRWFGRRRSAWRP